MYTDPDHIRIQDPGKIQGNIVFDYLDAFGKDKQTIEKMKNHYQQGGLGDVTVKKYLIEVLNDFLEPIAKRRALLAKDSDMVMKVVLKGTQKVREVAAKTMQEVRHAICLDY